MDIEESPYLRRQRQVEVRRSRLRGRRLARTAWAALAVAVLAALLFGGYHVVRFAVHDSRFVLKASGIEIAGLNYIPRHQVEERFAGDCGRSIFSIPLSRRRLAVQDISWVQSAWVSRAWPNRVRVLVRERVPVAFVRTAAGLALIDAEGAIMDRPARATFTFPVITGLPDQEPLEKRQARMRLYLALMQDIDSDGGHQSLDVSEVDVSDTEDAKVVIAAKDGPDAILVHLGNSNFLARFRVYLAHIRQWRQQFERIQSVDLRYDRQVIVNPDNH